MSGRFFLSGFSHKFWGQGRGFGRLYLGEQFTSQTELSTYLNTTHKHYRAPDGSFGIQFKIKLNPHGEKK